MTCWSLLVVDKRLENYLDAMKIEEAVMLANCRN